MATVINADYTGDDEPLYTRRMDDGELVYTAKVELALPTGPIALAVDFRIEYDQIDVSEPADVATGVGRIRGRVEWWGTLTVTDVPTELWQALGSRVPIRTLIGVETHVLVSKIEPISCGVGDGENPSRIRLDGSGPPPQFLDVDERDVTAFT